MIASVGLGCRCLLIGEESRVIALRSAVATRLGKRASWYCRGTHWPYGTPMRFLPLSDW